MDTNLTISQQVDALLADVRCRMEKSEARDRARLEARQRQPRPSQNGVSQPLPTPVERDARQALADLPALPADVFDIF